MLWFYCNSVPQIIAKLVCTSLIICEQTGFLSKYLYKKKTNYKKRGQNMLQLLNCGNCLLNFSIFNTA